MQIPGQAQRNWYHLYMKPIYLIMIASSACSLQEPNPHYLGKCQDPVITEWDQDRHSLCPTEVRDWGTQDPKTGACYYRSICGQTIQVGGCYIAPTDYCSQTVQDTGKLALINMEHVE